MIQEYLFTSDKYKDDIMDKCVRKEHTKVWHILLNTKLKMFS